MGRVLSGKYPIIKSSEFVIPRQTVPPGASVTLLEPTYYRYAFMLFYGDGGDGVIINVKIGGEQHQTDGATKAIGVAPEKIIEIEATNTSPYEQTTPTISIAYMVW